LSRSAPIFRQSCAHHLRKSGQNYDYEVNGIFFDELGIRKPDYFLDVSTTSLGRLLGEILTKTEEVLLKERPDAVLILGDTNSSIACVIAKRLRIPVYHMEAGNRCFDENVPEETNRRLVDHVADFNLAYTEHARRNLPAEGLHPRRILLTGAPMKEVLLHHLEQFKQSTILESLGLTPKRYMLVSAHREENVDNPARLGKLLDCLEAASQKFELPILVSTHPRTRKRLEDLGREVPGVVFHKPLGFIDYVRLQQDAFCVLSDGGTISEESAILGFPAVTVRDSIERPEALDSGSIIMTGLDADNVVEAVQIVVRDHTAGDVVPQDYAIDNCSERAVRFILSTHRRHAQWAGIR